MSNDSRVMSFAEFRGEESMQEVVRQQREHFRNDVSVDALKQPGALGVAGWVEWPDGERAQLAEWPIWPAAQRAKATT